MATINEMSAVADRLAKAWLEGDRDTVPSIVEPLTAGEASLTFGMCAGALHKHNKKAMWEFVRDVVNPHMLSVGGSPYGIPDEFK